MDTNLTLELFIGRGMIDKSLAKDIKEEMIASGKELPEVLADFGIIGSKDDIWQMIASDLGTEFITLDNFQPDPNVQNMMPATLVRLHGALPVRHGPEGLYVCLVDPLNPQTVEDLRFALGQDIHVLVAPDYQISERINELYGGESAAMSDLMQELNNMQVNNETEDSAAAPVIRFVDLVITQAIKEKASDIHFEPFEKEFKIRYRVDGALYEMQPPPVHLSVPVISRVKVMANMNIAERRIPQDGRIVPHRHADSPPLHIQDFQGLVKMEGIDHIAGRKHPDIRLLALIPGMHDPPRLPCATNVQIPCAFVLYFITSPAIMQVKTILVRNFGGEAYR